MFDDQLEPESKSMAALILLGNDELPVFRDLQQTAVIRQVGLRAGCNRCEELPRLFCLLKICRREQHHSMALGQSRGNGDLPVVIDILSHNSLLIGLFIERLERSDTATPVLKEAALHRSRDLKQDHR